MSHVLKIGIVGLGRLGKRHAENSALRVPRGAAGSGSQSGGRRMSLGPEAPCRASQPTTR